jgi:hypothetical protein
MFNIRNFEIIVNQIDFISKNYFMWYFIFFMNIIVKINNYYQDLC